MKKKSNLLLIIILFVCIILGSCVITFEINFVNSYVEALVNKEDLDRFIEDSNEYNIHFKIKSAHIEELDYDCSPFEAMCYYNPDLAVFMIDKGYVNESNVDYEELYITLSSQEENRFKLYNRLFKIFNDKKIYLLNEDKLIDLILISVCSPLNLDDERVELGNNITSNLLDSLSVDSKKFNEVLDRVMYSSIDKNNLLLMKYLYSNYDINLNQRYNDEFSDMETTFLISAARLGRIDILKWLVFHGADTRLKANNKTAYEHCLESFNIRKDYLSNEIIEEYEKCLDYLEPFSIERGLDDVGGMFNDFLNEK